MGTCQDNYKEAPEDGAELSNKRPYIYIYIYIRVCMCVYIYIYTHTHTHIKNTE